MLNVTFETALLALCLLAPDMLLNRQRAMSRKAMDYIPLVALMAFSIVAIGNAGIEAGLLAILFVGAAAWHLSYAYFGDMLRPESVLLLVKPDHLRDAADVARKEYARFRYPLAVLALSCAAAVATATFVDLPDRSAFHLPLLAPLILALIGINAAFKSKGRGGYPKLHMPGVVGSLFALALALKWGIGGVRSMPQTVDYEFDSPPEGPLTVAVIMGESIALDRMSLYRPGLATTPNLDRMRESAGPLHLYARTGFAAALSSNASVAGFLSGSPFPWRTKGARTLFDLAGQQGFRTAYLSSQVRTPLDALGGASFVNQVQTQESDADLFARRKDWMLVDLTSTLPQEGNVLAVYYHRVNHAPYFDHDIRPSSETIYSRPKNDAEVIANYDVGMRVYDRMLEDLVREIARRPGDIFVFVSSDHNELLGQAGFWGHTRSGAPEGAAVPMMLLTNRPDHPLVEEFRTMENCDAFSISRLIMSLMGVTPVASEETNGFYVGNPLPFAMAGYMHLKQEGDGRYMVDLHDRSGVSLRRDTADLAPFL